MNRHHKILISAFISAAMLLPGVAQAMPIQVFDRMSARDQDDYVVLLLTGAQQVLTDAGSPDQAAQVQKLFTEKLAGEDIPLGLIEFESNLDIARVADAKNHLKKPNDPRVEVEDAMFLTLQKNHIDLPDSFFTVNSNFHPKLPPQSK